MADELDSKKLTAITNELIASISSPAFVARMKKLKETPMENRLKLASKTLTPAVLTKAGVKFPKGMRITSRYFEPGKPGIIEVTDHGAVFRDINSLPGAVGAWACACGGAATVCGGAGGGS